MYDLISKKNREKHVIEGQAIKEEIFKTVVEGLVQRTSTSFIYIWKDIHILKNTYVCMYVF